VKESRQIRVQHYIGSGERAENIIGNAIALPGVYTYVGIGDALVADVRVNKEVDSGRASFVTLQGFGDAEVARCI
jgi:hypothetical protein